jgi:hypothetical protein
MDGTTQQPIQHGQANRAMHNVNTNEPVWDQQPLNTLDVACLIINKMIGTGIFFTPSTVTFLVGNKVTALFLWIFGGLYSFAR